MSDQSEPARRVYVRPKPNESPELFGHRVLNLLKHSGEVRGPEGSSRVDNDAADD
jgi:hypothetical protein